MAVFIKGLDCDCPDCGATPCESGCLCILSELETEATDGYAEWDYAYNVIGQTAIDKDLFISFDVNSASGSAQLIVSADNTPLYSSGCVADGLYTTTVTIPANTLEIEVYVEQECAGAWAESSWIVELTCEDA